MDTLNTATTRDQTPPKRRIWLRRFAWGTLVTAVLLGGFVVWVLTTCFAEPPSMDPQPAIVDAVITTNDDGRTHLGKSWFEKRAGRSLLYVEGDPFTLGYSNSMLTAEFLELQERSLMETVRSYLPGTLSFYSAALLVLVHNRRLPDYVTDEYKLEIFGLSSARTADPYPQFGNRYHRILNYHAAHDISHWIWDEPVLGCTSFAAVGSRTRSGHLIVGRNFDWESGSHFDENKVITLYRPDEGRAFLSVSWPGMAGAVTGLNDAKIFCAINGAHTEHMGFGVGRPVSLVVREVLQYSDNLEDAAAIIGAAPVFVGDTFLLADGKSGEAIVVEKSPAAFSVRTMDRELILQTNHFESPSMRDDRGNLEYMRDGTSVSRRDRLAGLLTRHSGELDPPTTAQILRDRLGPGDTPRGLGHRGTINPMIATHSVVADVTEGILWVSRGRHQLGVYDAYGIDRFGDPIADPIPADPALTDGEYERLGQFRSLLSPLESLLADGTATEELRQKLERAAALNPLSPEILRMQGRFFELVGDRRAALSKYRAARDAFPPFRINRESLVSRIRQLESGRSP